MLILDVPYQEKDEAKRLGARWNPEIKKWYIERKEDYYKFAKWILPYGDTVVCNNIYVVEGKQKCSRCKKDTRVIGFGIGSYVCLNFLNYFTESDEEYKECIQYLKEEMYNNNIIVIGPIKPIPKPVLEHIQSKYNYKKCTYKNRRSRWFLNCCDNCNQQQSNYKLFDDDTPFESPFFVDSEEKAKKLLIYKIKLRNDIIITKPEDSSVFLNSCHWLLKQYADIIPLDIEC